MGIKEKGFADWVAATFPEAIKDLAPTEKSHFDIVCIDINPLLHTCLRNAKGEAQFVKLFFADLDRCMRLTIPQATVYLAVDGSPPLAKMKEQIRRRRSKAPSKNKHIDSSQITPGCTFQIRVTEYLYYYAARYLATKNHPSGLRFVIDGAETPGEGEAKIMKYLFDHREALYAHHQIAVFSGDSDVILQSLLCPCRNIFVLRPGIGHYIAFSIAQLRMDIVRELGGHHNTNEMRSVRDFCLLIMFSGNDYMHKLRGGKISKIWPVYKRFRLEAGTQEAWKNRYLIRDNHTFDFGVLSELLIRIRRLTIKSVFKPDMSLSLAMLGIKDEPSNPVIADDDDESDDEDDLEELQTISKEQRLPRYTKHIANYLEALLWTLSMYSTGECSDAYFSQVGRYLTIEQLLTFLARDVPSSRQITVPRAGPNSYLLTILCPISLLDASKASLVPLAWRTFFQDAYVRDLSRSMNHDATLADESERVQSIIYAIGELLIRSSEEGKIDINSPMVQLLTFRQQPVEITQGQGRHPWATELPPLGSSHAEIWSDVPITLPALPPKTGVYSQKYQPHTHPFPNARRRPVGTGFDRVYWPFVPRKPQYQKT